MMRRHFAADGMPLSLLNAQFTKADVLYLLSTTCVARDQLNKEAISMGITGPTAEQIFAATAKRDGQYLAYSPELTRVSP